jgi:HK97 family phage major capsid protein
MPNPLPTIDQLKEQLTAARERAEATDAAILATGKDADVQVVADLEAKFTEEQAEIARFSAALKRRESLETAMAEVPRETKKETSPHVQINEPLTYRPNGPASFFKDLYSAQKQDYAAIARLQRHQREMDIRADLTSTDTAGGDFVVPIHMQEQWAALARAGRVFADAIGPRPIPASGDSFTFPTITGGTSTAVQTDGGTVSETDAVTATVTLTVRTIAGQQDLSRQLFERSLPGMDEVIAQDLAASYAVTLDTHLLNHATDGILNDSNINSVTYTDASPTIAELYPKLADAVQRINALRFMPADAIFMAPRRWGWFLAGLDSSNRPLITPYAPQNSVAGFAGARAQGLVGSMLGLDVYVDANLPLTLGAGTNEDPILVTRLADNLFFESPTPRARVFEETLSGTLQVRIQVYGYIAYTSKRYSKAHSKITGTGLVAPTF